MITYVIILIAVVLIGIPTIFWVNKNPKVRIPLQLFYAIVIVILAILLVINVNKPIDFEKVVDLRSEAVITKLKDIRNIQASYKDKFGRFSANFDTLIYFVQTDSFAIEDIREAPGASWNQDEMDKAEALKKGILLKSASYVNVLDSLWKDKSYEIENIRFVPYTDQIEFSMGAGEIETASKVKVKVFECYVLYEDLFNGLDEQLIVNYIDEKTKYGGFEGIRVGSLTETTNNAGNWEK